MAQSVSQRRLSVSHCYMLSE